MTEKPYRPPEVNVAAFEAVFLSDIWKVQHELDRLGKMAVVHGKHSAKFVAAHLLLSEFMEEAFTDALKKDVA